MGRQCQIPVRRLRAAGYFSTLVQNNCGINQMVWNLELLQICPSKVFGDEASKRNIFNISTDFNEP